MVDLAFAAGVLVEDGERLRATVRFSTLGRHIFVHSAYPTVDTDSVFFGPDTYRFCNLIARTLGGAKRARRLVDIGCGSGAGGIIASSNADRIVLTDVNHAALFHSKVNTRLAGIEAHAEIIESDILAAIEGPFDVVTANPPYLVDPRRRAYRDGGGSFGEGLAIRMVEESLERLEPGGRLILYTGAAIVAGTDTFLEAVRPVCEGGGCTWSYDELDPDVFGEEIELNDSYAAADRIAAVALVAHKSLDR